MYEFEVEYRATKKYQVETYEQAKTEMERIRSEIYSRGEHEKRIVPVITDTETGKQYDVEFFNGKCFEKNTELLELYGYPFHMLEGDS